MRVYRKAKDKSKKPTKPRVSKGTRQPAKPLTPVEQQVSTHVADTLVTLRAAVGSEAVQTAIASGHVNTSTDSFPWNIFDTQLMAVADPIAELTRRSLVIPHLMPKSAVIQTNFNHLDPRVAMSARTQASKLSAAMTKEQYAKVRTIIGNGVAKGDTVKQISSSLRNHIGLSARQDAQMTSAVLDATQSGIDAGLTGEELMAQVQNTADSLYSRLINVRANMIARTETMQAQNSGLLIGIQQAVEDPQSSVDNTYLKRWIATDDERTCETCGALDGTEVPLDQNFSTDNGDEIGYPLEDGSTPHPNCRCTVGIVPPDTNINDYLNQDTQDATASDVVPTDSADMVDIAASLKPSQDIINMALQMFNKEFNPDQPRDDHGRWTSGGFTGDQLAAHQEKYYETYGQDRYGQLAGITKEQFQAIKGYTSNGYKDVNGYLRTGAPVVPDSGKYPAVEVYSAVYSKIVDSLSGESVLPQSLTNAIDEAGGIDNLDFDFENIAKAYVKSNPDEAIQMYIDQKSAPLDKIVSNLDSLIATAPSMGDATLYRVVDNSVLDKLSVGSIMTDKGYTSTTTTDITHESNLSTRIGLGSISNSVDTVAIIQPNPSGNNPALGVQQLYVATTSDSALSANEQEVLLPRDTSLKFMGYQNNLGTQAKVAIFQRVG